MRLEHHLVGGYVRYISPHIIIIIIVVQNYVEKRSSISLLPPTILKSPIHFTSCPFHADFNEECTPKCLVPLESSFSTEFRNTNISVLKSAAFTLIFVGSRSTFSDVANCQMSIVLFVCLFPCFPVWICARK